MGVLLGDRARIKLVCCGLFYFFGTVARCCFRNQSGSVAGAVHGDDIFVPAPREEVLMVVANSRPRTQHPQSFAALVQGRVGRRCRSETRQGGDRRTWIVEVETSCVCSRWKVSGSVAVSPLPQDSQSVINHSRRQGHSVASKHFGLWGLWLKKAQVDRMMALEQRVHLQLQKNGYENCVLTA